MALTTHQPLAARAANAHQRILLFATRLPAARSMQCGPARGYLPVYALRVSPKTLRAFLARRYSLSAVTLSRRGQAGIDPTGSIITPHGDRSSAIPHGR
jgi:hypothetical protein